MSNQDKEKFMRRRISNLLDAIEIRTGVMAHEDPEIKDELKRWQDGELKSSYFNLTLCNYLDELNGGDQ